MSNFKMILLKELCEINIGKTPSRSEKKYWGSGYKWLSIADMKSKYISKSKEEITEVAIEKCNMKVIPKNTVVMSFKLSIGKLGIVKENFFSNEAIASFPIKKTANLIPEYLYLALSTINLDKFTDKAVKGKTLNKAKLNMIEIPYTDLETQGKIVEMANQCIKIIENRKSQITALNQLAESVFVEMFGNPVMNTKNYPIEKLGDIGILERGKSKHRPRNAPELLDGPYPLIQTGDVANSSLFIKNFKSTYSEIGLQQSKLWPEGTLCITIAANIAKTGILKFNACFPDSVVGFIPSSKISNIYIHYWFGFFQQILEDAAPESAQKNINLRILKDIEVIIPPLQLIEKFEEKIIAIVEYEEKLMYSLEKMQFFYNSLLQKAFKGELFQEE